MKEIKGLPFQNGQLEPFDSVALVSVLISTDWLCRKIIQITDRY